MINKLKQTNPNFEIGSLFTVINSILQFTYKVSDIETQSLAQTIIETISFSVWLSHSMSQLTAYYDRPREGQELNSNQRTEHSLLTRNYFYLGPTVRPSLLPLLSRSSLSLTLRTFTHILKKIFHALINSFQPYILHSLHCMFKQLD